MKRESIIYKPATLFINSNASNEFDFKLVSSRCLLEYFHPYFCNHNINKKPQTFFPSSNLPASPPPPRQ